MKFTPHLIATVTAKLSPEPFTDRCLSLSHDIAQHKRSWRQAGYSGDDRMLEEALFRGGVRS